jgi:TolB-like protein
MRGFIEELKHRNVFRVGIAYVVAGWLIAQVADLATDAFNAPDWVMQALIILLLAGWPVALFLAWAYELTPEGMKKAHEVPLDAPKDPRAGRVLNVVIVGTLLLAVILLGLDKLRPLAGSTPEVEKSIAVLPFDDFSPDRDHAWFADGLTEEILNSLARTPDLLIASRTSSFAYRDTSEDLPTIAAQLGVAHILEGSVRRAGDRLRVTAQLIRVADDKHLWSKNFDGNSSDSISVQEEIAIAIARALETAMDPEELAKMMSAGTRSVEAWETYLLGLAQDRENSNLEGGEAGVRQAIALFDKAVDIDPGFADAHLMLADLWQEQINPTSTRYLASGLTLAERQEHYEGALSAAARHARSDMTRLEAEMRMADFELRVNDQIAAARKMTKFAPERRVGWSWLNYLYMMVGDYEQAREAGLKAWTLPYEPGTGSATIIQSMHRADLDAAINMVDEVLLDPNPSLGVLYQSHRALLAAGLTERAAEVADTYLRQQQDDAEGRTIVEIRQACAEGRVPDADKLFESVDPDSNSRWLLLKTLGRDTEARELLMPLDMPETLFILSNYMTYRSFEARDYPVLWKTLSSQGINRPPARPMAYRCDRALE